MEGSRKKGILNDGVTVEKENLNVVQQTIKTTRRFFYPSQVYSFSSASSKNALIARRIIRDISYPVHYLENIGPATEQSDWLTEVHSNCRWLLKSCNNNQYI